IIEGNLNFSRLLTIDDFISFQVGKQVAIGGILMPGILLVINPFAAIAMFSILLPMFSPWEFSSGPLSKKWSPIDDFSGKSFSLVKIVEILRFTTMVVLFVDTFLAGGSISGIPIVDMLIFIALTFFVAILLAFIKTKKKEWFLDKRVFSFIHVHNIFAIVAAIFSILLITT
ncbi:MAG: hypothetical protein ACTSYS_05430, partial [Promethearchaeota archaeon]